MNIELAEITKPEYINIILIVIALLAITIIITTIITLRNKEEIANFLSDIKKSLYIQDGGFSTRKMIAWFGVWTAGSLTLKHSTEGNVDTLLQTWLMFVAACLGMIVYGDIQKKKIDANSTNIENKEISK